MSYLQLILTIVLFPLLLGGFHPKDQSLTPDFTKADKIEVHYFKPKSIYITYKHYDLLFLKALITKAKNNPDLHCDTTGEIIYLRNNVQLFKVYFCTRETGSKYNSTGAVTFKLDTQDVKVLNYGFRNVDK
jgi:hypothetical protein